MQEMKCVIVNGREVPVLISDEKEALLAAKAAGRAIVGLWRPGQEMEEISAAKYVVEDPEDATAEYLERVARRHLGFPWHICESERLLIREMFANDFDEIWLNRIGRGFGSIEELEAYTKNQYIFYEFGFWALVEKSSGDLIGMAGLTVPGSGSDDPSEGEIQEEVECYALNLHGEGETLELGYHIFPQRRRQGFAGEACRAILRYGAEELGVTKFIVRISKDNHISRHLAKELGFCQEGI